MAGVSIKGWWAVLLVIVAVGFIVSWAFHLGLWTAVLVVGLVVAAPVLGALVAIFLPLPGIFRIIAGFAVSVLALLFGLQYLGVIH